MRLNHLLGTLPALLALASCAKAGTQGAQPDAGATADASCGALCDADGDGVVDTSDKCPGTPPGVVVNHNGCSDSQLTATLQPVFPSYGLAWTSAGAPGRAGGLTWEYTGITRGDLFHIYWIVCDDPATPCGLSLDGPIDTASENWQFSAPDSDLPMGKLGFTNATHIALADTTTPLLEGRLTVTIVDGAAAPIPFADVTALDVTARTGRYGAEITSTGFKVVALAEVRDAVTLIWTPYLDYYDAAPTPDPGGATATSFGGSFYDR